MKERILDLHNHDLKNIEICKMLNVTPGVVSGIIWRHKNPGMWTKTTKSNEHDHHKYEKRKKQDG